MCKNSNLSSLPASASADKDDLFSANVFCIQTHLTQTDSVLKKVNFEISQLADDNKSMKNTQHQRVLYALHGVSKTINQDISFVQTLFFHK